MISDFLKQIIKEAGFLAKGYYREGIEYQTKSDPTDLVTQADREVNNFLIKKIREKYPTHGIISEEEPDEINPGAEYTWVIDPVDGTRNFANHIGVWCTMIGITKNNEPYLGAVYDALNDELFFAEVGQGAFLNDKPIKVSTTVDVKSFSIVFSCGQNRNNSPYNIGEEKLKKYLRFYHNLTHQDGHWVANFSTALSICHLSAGRLDTYMMCGGLYHDYLPGFIIATEAGARFTDSDGQIWQRGRKDSLVANPQLHQKLLRLFE